MSQAPGAESIDESRNTSAWLLAVSTTSLVALVGLLIAIQQFFVEFLHDQSAHTRTSWGLLFLFIGALGPAIPLVLLAKRTAFVQLAISQQRLISIGVPLAYASVFGLCMVASTYTNSVVLMRPPPTLKLLIDLSRTNEPFRIVMQGRSGELPSASGYRTSNDAFLRYHFEGFQTYLRFPRETTIQCDGIIKKTNAGKVDITIDIEATESFRFQVEGPSSIAITQNEEKVLPGTQFPPGKYRLVVTDGRK